MKKVLLLLSLLGLVFVQSDINALFWGGNNNTPSDYPSCCTPRTETIGCRTRCCRGSLVGRPRWSCCRTLRCCKPKKVCCPRYKCCKPKPACCPAEVPYCETNSCVTTPRTTCVEDWSSMSTETASYSGSNTTCTEDYSGAASYPTSYGQPFEHRYQQEELV